MGGFVDPIGLAALWKINTFLLSEIGSFEYSDINIVAQ
jgi:hypothetical protein